jgi:hypothetical protein
MKSIALQDLPRWSDWPARLLGIASWKIPERTIEKIDSEYDKDKYAKCLAYLEGQSGSVTPEQVKQFEFGSNQDRSICISLGDDLYELSLKEARSMYYDLLSEALAPEIAKSNSVVELGAGYGYNLWMLRDRFREKTFFGGEYSANATQIATRLYADSDRISVRQFNFYSPESYQFLGGLKPPILILTSHAVEQIPRAAPLLDNLAIHRDRIGSVFHFEPVHGKPGSTLLQLLRYRYTETNDYNRDLLPELAGRQNVEIVSRRDNVYGMNPLNPSSIIHWRYC